MSRMLLTIAAAVAVAAFAQTSVSEAAVIAKGAPLAKDGLIVQVAQKKRVKKKSELDRSIDQGTVPARYRSRVPREYQQYVPFEKGR